MEGAIKQTFQKMNLDADVRLLQQGEYRLLENGIPLQPSSSVGSLRGVISNIFGNEQITNASLPSGTNKVIGFLSDKIGNRAFFFVWNNTASNYCIFQYKNGIITLVMQSAVLDFASTDIISADIVGDVLFWANHRSDTKRIDVVKAMAGGTYTPTLVELALIKQPPLLPLTLALEYDATKEANNLAGNYFQFYHRYIYENNDESVFGPCSRTTNSFAYPATAQSYSVDSVSTIYNIVLSGSQIVDGVFYSSGVVLLTSQTNPVENGIWSVNPSGAWTRSLLANGATTTSNLFVYSRIYDGLNNSGTIWKIKTPGGVVGTASLVFIRIDGPNVIRVTKQSEPSSVVIKQVDFAVRINGGNELIVYRSEKIGAFSTSHTFINDSYLFTVPDSDSFTWNHSIPLKSRSLNIFKSRLFLFNNTEGYNHTTTTKLGLVASNITPPARLIYSSAKSGGVYLVGIVFFDLFRRHSGVKCESSITIPDSAPSLSPTTNYNIFVDTSTVSSDVPSWATHFSLMVTKCQNYDYFLDGWTVDIYHFYKKENGDFVYDKLITAINSTGTLLDISDRTRNNQGYTFTKGDRVKIYNIGASSSYTEIIDVEIIGQEGKFLITRVLTELKLSIALNDNRKYEIYTPKKPISDQFYETGFTFPINQIGVGFFLNGDVENNSTPVYLQAAPFIFDGTPVSLPVPGLGYSTIQPYNNVYLRYFMRHIQSMNIWQKNYAKWVTQAGRGLVKSDSRQLGKSTYIRFGQQYIQNANFFGLNVFYALDEYALPLENGHGVALVDAAQVMVAVCEAETASVYIGEAFVNTTDQNNFIAKTDSVVGDTQKYLGGHGCIHPLSIVERNSRVYFLNARKGAIIRRSQDGLTVISEYGVRALVAELCEYHTVEIPNFSRIVATWDPQYDCYVISFVDLSLTRNPTTLYFHEQGNSWVCKSSEGPDFCGMLEQRKFGFRAGAMWRQSLQSNYNKWFGVQYDRVLNIEQGSDSLEKVWESLEVDVESIYNSNSSNELVMFVIINGALFTQINYKDFVLRGSAWRSAFFRWLGDANFPDQTISKYSSPARPRSQSITLQIFSNVNTNGNPMRSITTFFRRSPNTMP
jgi:hypothetical protein